MYLLDLMQEYQDKDSEEWAESEFEILCRVQVIGSIDLGCLYFQPWEFLTCGEPSTEVRACYLRLLEEKPRRQTPLEVPPKKEQYYMPGGILEEFAALMTLFTRAHFVVSRRLKMLGAPIMARFASNESVAQTVVDSQKIRLEDIQPNFELLRGLKLRESSPDKKVRRVGPFMLAARMYYLALSHLWRDHTLAYLLLVSAIEALLHDYDPGKVTLADINARAAELLSKYLSKKRYREVESVLLQRLPKKKERFQEFIVHHLPETYWSDATRPAEGWKRFEDGEQVKKYAAQIYGARSDTLHDGLPFPPDCHVRGSEKPTGGRILSGKKEWKETNLVPPVREFERIVHYVLIEYLRREAALGFGR